MCCVAPPPPPPPPPPPAIVSKYTDYNHAADETKAWFRVQYPTAPGDPPAGTPQKQRITLVCDPSPETDPRRPSGKVMRVEIRPYDNPTGPAPHPNGDIGNGHKSRAEVYDMYPTSGGSSKPWAAWPLAQNAGEWWISYKVFLDPTWTWAPTNDPLHKANQFYMILMQLKEQFGGSPPFELGIDQYHRFKLEGTKRSVPLAAATPGQWHDFLFHVKLDPDPTKGFIEIWLNDALVMPAWHGATMDLFRGQPDPIYFKEGEYRYQGWMTTHIAYFGDTRIGTTRQAVASR